MTQLNPHISVDCVIFGFDTHQLKVLLIERERIAQEDPLIPSGIMKLPGNLILINEDIDSSAYRVLKELTGLDNIFLKQLEVFGKPDRLSNPNDLMWLKVTTGLQIERVVTIAYYSLVKIHESSLQDHIEGKTSWIPVEKIPQLAFDHNIIVDKALNTLRKELRTEPIVFELLPKKFTIRQLQNLYEIILGFTLDSRNFRKKISKLEYLIPLQEKEIGVNHKPAQYYKFDRKTYTRQQKELEFVI